MFLENIQEVLRVKITNIFHNEFIGDDVKLNRASLVMPETRSDDGFVVIVFF